MKPRVTLPAVLLLWIAVGFAGWQSWHTALSTFGLDFYQFWVAPQVVSESQPINLYDASVREEQGLQWFRTARKTEGQDRMRAVARERKLLDCQSTPFMYAVFDLFTGSDYESDFRRFHALCLILGVVAMLSLARSAGLTHTAGLAAVLVMTIAFQPFLSEVRVGNVNRLQLLGLAAFVALRRAPGFAGRDLLSGIVLAACTFFKPNLVFVPLLICVAALMNGRNRKLASTLVGLLLGSAGSVALGAWYFGSMEAWSQWMAAMPELMKEGSRPLERGNYGMARLLLDATGTDLSMVLTAFWVLVCGVAMFLFRRAPTAAASATTATANADREADEASTHTEAPARADQEREFREDLLALGLGSAAFLLSAGLIWIHYMMLLLPALLLLLNPVGTMSAMRAGLAAIAVVLLCVRPEDNRDFAWAMCAATLLTTVLCLWELAQLRRLDGSGRIPSQEDASMPPPTAT